MKINNEILNLGIKRLYMRFRKLKGEYEGWYEDWKRVFNGVKINFPITEFWNSRGIVTRRKGRDEVIINNEILNNEQLEYEKIEREKIMVKKIQENIGKETSSEELEGQYTNSEELQLLELEPKTNLDEEPKIISQIKEQIKELEKLKVDESETMQSETPTTEIKETYEPKDRETPLNYPETPTDETEENYDMDDNEKNEIILRGTELKEEGGKIGNYNLIEPVNSLELTNIKIEDGNVLRGNHYHPEQEQKALVVSGSYISIYKDTTKPNAETKQHLVQKGDLVITPPNTAHAQIFLEETNLINLTEDGYEKFVPYNLVKQEEIEIYKEKIKGPVKEQIVEIEEHKENQELQKACRICKEEKLKKVISLGEVPLTDKLLSAEETDEEKLYPLELVYCENCHLCQLSYIVPSEKLSRQKTLDSETAKKHAEETARTLSGYFSLNENSLVIDIGSGDGTLLNHFMERGSKVVGIESEEKLSEIAKDKGLEIINKSLNEATKEISESKGKAKLITATDIFAQEKDIDKFMENVKILMEDDGVFVIEVQYILDTIRELTFNNICHESVSYFSILALKEFFKRHEMEIFGVEHFQVSDGIIRVFVQKSGGKYPIDRSVNEFSERETIRGLDRFNIYEEFANRINEGKERVLETITNIKSEGKKIFGYGAMAKSIISLNFYGINNEQMDYIIEDDFTKHNKIIPGAKIPIKDKKSLEEVPDYIYILSWNHTDEILRNNGDYREKGVKFIIPYPEFKII